jgi:hypothetical protein
MLARSTCSVTIICAERPPTARGTPLRLSVANFILAGAGGGALIANNSLLLSGSGDLTCICNT